MVLKKIRCFYLNVLSNIATNQIVKLPLRIMANTHDFILVENDIENENTEQQDNISKHHKEKEKPVHFDQIELLNENEKETKSAVGKGKRHDIRDNKMKEKTVDDENKDNGSKSKKKSIRRAISKKLFRKRK